MDTTNEITVKVFHISPISKFPCSQGNGTMEGKVPDREQTSDVCFKREELSFQNKQPSLFARSFLTQWHLTAYTSEN